jgi:oxygen-independent coproporphyrinogen-3 oxidase
VLDEDTRRLERILLEIRLEGGLPIDVLSDPGKAAAPLADGLVVRRDDRLMLTDHGRLLADAVVRELS